MGSRNNIQISNYQCPILILFILFSLSSSVCSSKGLKQLQIDDRFLCKYVTQVKNPHLLTEKDLKRKPEKEAYKDYGYSFLVEGDFNKDGNTDYAIAAKYNDENSKQAVFVAIITVRNSNVAVEFFYPIPSHDRIFLHLEQGTMHVENIDRRYDVILVALELWTDYVFVVAWDGKKYIKSTEAYFLPEKR